MSPTDQRRYLIPNNFVTLQHDNTLPTSLHASHSVIQLQSDLGYWASVTHGITEVQPSLDTAKTSNHIAAFMTSRDKDVADLTLHESFPSGDPVVSLKGSSSNKSHNAEATHLDTPYTLSNASLSSTLRPTASPSPSRSVSPDGRAAYASVTSNPGVLRSGENNGPPPTAQDDFIDNARDLILRSFVPHVAVHASQDAEDLALRKGVKGGFRELLRPFGDLVQGKVVVRDSAGASRSWDNYGVRFVDLGDVIENTPILKRKVVEPNGTLSNGSSLASDQIPAGRTRSSTSEDLARLEDLVEHYLSMADTRPDVDATEHWRRDRMPRDSASTSPFYALYLRRLLSGVRLTPYETFPHPVACIITISSRNSSPIEALRQLYSSTSQGNGKLPSWVNNEFLRYYLLVHDEDRDDITKSTALFDQMKRHFGLHCHMLRLRSNECVSTDDDSVHLPQALWISAEEELAQIHNRDGNEDTERDGPCLFESDFAAIKTFVREMVTQSVVPFMESRVTTWNDQVASRRRGISGRFMSLSKRWTGFGSAAKGLSSSGLSGTATQSGNNYNSIQGFYGSDTAEATMRRLADYAFMLRDWKLALSTYELLRTDFASDKAWKYLAGANEMAAISSLLGSSVTASRSRSEVVDQMFETASYSYVTRCSDPYAAVRCLALGAELLKIRGGAAADHAAKWATRILDLNIVGPIGHALFTERVGTCYQSLVSPGPVFWGSRRRKAALWNVLASEVWLGLGKNTQSERCLNEAERLYDYSAQGNSGLAFREMRVYLDLLQHELRTRTATADSQTGRGGARTEVTSLVEEHSERLGQQGRRKSLIVADATASHMADIGPLSSLRGIRHSPAPRDENFQ